MGNLLNPYALGSAIPAGIVFELDAGVLASFSGGGSQLLRNITTPADSEPITAYDFYLGQATGAGADDPIFNGSAGGNSASEYFSGDGADFFGLNDVNTTFINSLHKDNAVFTWYGFVKTPTTFSTTEPNALFGTGGVNNTDKGVYFAVAADGDLDLVMTNGSTQQIVNGSNTVVPAVATNYFVALSYNEATGAGLIYLRAGGAASTASFTQTYTSASAAAATYPLTLFAAGHITAGYNIMPSGWRLWREGFFNVALSEGQLEAIYNMYKSKLGY
jgi:hypothetical protein